MTTSWPKLDTLNREHFIFPGVYTMLVTPYDIKPSNAVPI